MQHVMSRTKIEKIAPETLLRLVLVVMENSDDFKYLGGTQPFLMRYKDVEYYVYIKNISSAYFTDRDATTRAQLPNRTGFDKIKSSNSPFIFLGYDPDNDVYVCWNYHIAKQRLNASNNVSFYSRAFFQDEVKQGHFLRKTLKNGDTPVFFKRKDLISFFEQIESFFPLIPQTNNNLLERFESRDNVDYQADFERYVIESGLSQNSCSKYSNALSGRISDGISMHLGNRPINIFKFGNIGTLEKWKSELFQVPEFIELDKVGKSMYSCAMTKYIQFQSDRIAEGAPTRNTEHIKVKPPVSNKLLKIDDLELLATIRPMIESNRMLMAVQEVGNHYSGEYLDMTLPDWMNLVKSIRYTEETAPTETIANKIVDDYIQQFKNLRTSKQRGAVAPHKATLLLSVMDLIKDGVIKSNEIELTDLLEQKFMLNWKKYVGGSDIFKPNIALPFFYMHSEPFWTLVPHYGGEEVITQLRQTNPSSIMVLHNNFKYAVINKQVFSLLQDNYYSKIITETLIAKIDIPKGVSI